MWLMCGLNFSLLRLYKHLTCGAYSHTDTSFVSSLMAANLTLRFMESFVSYIVDRTLAYLPGFTALISLAQIGHIETIWQKQQQKKNNIGVFACYQAQGAICNLVKFENCQKNRVALHTYCEALKACLFHYHSAPPFVSQYCTISRTHPSSSPVAGVPSETGLLWAGVSVQCRPPRCEPRVAGGAGAPCCFAAPCFLVDSLCDPRRARSVPGSAIENLRYLSSVRTHAYYFVNNTCSAK